MKKEEFYFLSQVILLAFLSIVLTSCGGGGDSGREDIHPAGWQSPGIHGLSAKSAPGNISGFSYCQECHGGDFAGGSAETSCFPCHGVSAPHPAAPWRGETLTHTTTDPGNAPICALCHTDGANSSLSPPTTAPPGTAPGCFNNTLCHGPAGTHPEGWADPGIHGPLAKFKPTNVTGLSYCQECHGSDFAGGSAQTSCFTCHGVPAPHPARPWRGGAFTHVNTDPGNAAVCALCHTNGANSTRKPSLPAPPGTAPGCFNNTLCHASPEIHPPGWATPGEHGASAKNAPGNMAGFSYCQECHGSDFAGGSAQTSCFTCHGVPAPHPQAPWRGGALTHTTTDPGNAAVCALCHTNGTNSARKPSPPAPPGTAPGCFNNTLCHAAPGPHPAGWAVPTQHGASAKSPPGNSSGFSFCQECHGNDFAGGSSQTACFTCHGVPAPHPQAPWRGGALTHTTTDPGNAPVCSLCHAASPTTPSSSFGCFNSTLCHGQAAGHPAGWTTDHALAARTSNTGCGTAECHGTNYMGGAVGIGCYQCHLGGPDPGAGIMHPDRWPNPVQTHDNYLESINKNATSCSPTSPRGVNVAQYCHGQNLMQTAVRTAPPNGSWGTAPSCFTCHGKEWSVP